MQYFHHVGISSDFLITIFAGVVFERTSKVIEQSGVGKVGVVLLLGRLRLVFLVRLAVPTARPSLIDRHGSTFGPATDPDFSFPLTGGFSGTGEPRKASGWRGFHTERGALGFRRHMRRRW